MPPLAGLKVLELARVLAGPWAGADAGRSRRRGHQGREPGAATTRAAGARPSSTTRTAARDAAYYHACNRGKRSIARRFREARGPGASSASSRRESDVRDREFQGRRAGEIRPRLRQPRRGQPAAGLLLDHRLRPGRAVRAARRLRLHDPGHGRHHGPDRRRPTASRRRSASPSPTSSPASTPSSPSWRRSPERDTTGEGQHIDLALLDTQVGVLANQATELSGLRQGAAAHGQRASQHRALPGFRRPPTAMLIVAVGNDGQFRQAPAKCSAMPELADDPLYATNAARVVNRATLIPKLAGADGDVPPRRTPRRLRDGRRAGRPDQQRRPGFRRSAGDPSRHAPRPANGPTAARCLGEAARS